MTVEHAATKLRISPEKLSDWESDGARPTLNQIERMARAFRRPTAAFFLTEVPDEPKGPKEYYRSLAGASQLAFLPSDVVFAVRQARRLQGVSADLEEPPPSVLPRIKSQASATESATILREAIGVSLAQQMTFRTPGKALQSWREAIEATHTLVFRFRLPEGAVSGFSLAGTPPVIALNSHEAPSRQIFTMFHELCHICVGDSGICHTEIEPKSHPDRVEYYCNQVAAELLVPREALLAEESVVRLRAKRGNVLDALPVLARVFAVSRDVIIRRLLALGEVSAARGEEIKRMLAAEAAERAKREREKKRKLIIPPPTKVVGRLGYGFVSQVLEAHERGQIHYGDVADFLSVKLKWLPRIHKLVGEQQARGGPRVHH